MQGSTDQEDVPEGAQSSVPVPWLSSLSGPAADGLQPAEAFHEAVTAFQTLQNGSEGHASLSAVWQNVTREPSVSSAIASTRGMIKHMSLSLRKTIAHLKLLAFCFMTLSSIAVPSVAGTDTARAHLRRFLTCRSQFWLHQCDVIWL